MAGANLIVMIECCLKKVGNRQKNHMSQMLQKSHKRQKLPMLEMRLALPVHQSHHMSQILAKGHKPADCCAVFFHQAWS